MSPQAGVEQWRGTQLEPTTAPWISNIWININVSKEEFNDGTIPLIGSKEKGGEPVAREVWINALDFQEQFNDGHMI